MADSSSNQRVSVVIPAYNAADYLAECVESVLAQDVPDLELIVVDDGSTDETRSIAGRYGGALRYVWQPNSGAPSAPRNAGAQLATGDFLAFFDADDVMAEGKLRRQLDVLLRHPGAAMVISDYRNFDDSGDSPQTHFQTCVGLLAHAALASDGEAVLPPIVSNRLLIRENFSITSSPLFRREAWVAAQGFDEDLSASEDFDLVYRVARQHPIVLLSYVGFRRRMHDSNLSNQRIRILGNLVRSRLKLLSTESDPGLRRELKSSVARFGLGHSRALYECGEAGAMNSCFLALRHDPLLTMAEWRVLVRALPYVSSLLAWWRRGPAV